MQRKPTVYDIARRLGVSPATVSRTLNGSNLVSPQMQGRVLSAADALGYTRRVIRRPKARSILNIALFLPVTSARYAGLFYDVRELIAGVQEGLSTVRANLVVDLVGSTQLFEQKKLGELNGCLFAFCRPDERTAASIDDRRIPVALINRLDPKRTSVVPDTESGMRALVSRAREAGHTRIAFLGFSGAPEVSEARRWSFEAACAEFGTAGREARSVADVAEITSDLVQEVRSSGCTACLCFNDLLAMRFLDAARRAGLAIPADIGIAGFDNSPILDLSSTRIDTVSLSTAELGRRAGDWLSTAIIERSTGLVHERVPVVLVPGETLGG